MTSTVSNIQCVRKVAVHLRYGVSRSHPHA